MTRMLSSHALVTLMSCWQLNERLKPSSLCVVDVPLRTTPDTVAQLRSAPTTDVMNQPRDSDVTRTHADLVRSRLRSSITKSRSLNCRADSMVVSLSKHVIQVCLIVS